MTTTKYEQVSQMLEQYILDNRIQGRLPGIHKLAVLLHVNHITLRKAMRLLAEQGKLKILPHDGTYSCLDGGKRRSFRTIGFIYFPAYGDYADRLFDSFNREFVESGYRALNIISSPKVFADDPELLLQFPVDGFIFSGSSLTRRIISVLQKEKIPVISALNRQFPEINQVGMDYMEGHARAIRMLRANGCRRIAFLGYKRPSDFKTYLEDIRSVFEQELKTEFEPKLFYIRDGEAYFQKYGENCHKIIVDELLKNWKIEPPDGLISHGQLVVEVKRYLPHIRTVEFIPEQKSCAPSLANFSFCEDNAALLRVSAKRMLELLAGDDRVFSIKIPHLCRENEPLSNNSYKEHKRDEV